MLCSGGPFACGPPIRSRCVHLFDRTLFDLLHDHLRQPLDRLNNAIMPLQFMLIAFAGWGNRHQQAVIECLIEENRILKAQLGGALRFYYREAG